MLRTWILATVGMLAFAVLVWFAGPLLVIADTSPLASPAARALVIAVFVLQYVGQKLWGARRARRTNERVVSDLNTMLQAEPTAEFAQLRERFATALTELRRARLATRGPWPFGRSFLYQLPWYAIIGVPGSGKTTALANSGLTFPLAQKLEGAAVRGVGRTRDCDWWFADRAVLIDTAGRFATHESDRDADRNTWEAFLDLLLRTRPLRPLDGVLVTVSVEDLLESNGDQLAEQGRLLRARLDELNAVLRVPVPVYVLLTKCDLLPGFVDWFGTLSRSERDQAWGISFDSSDFADSFARVVEPLADTLVARLNVERDAQRRTRLFSLLTHVRSLGEPLSVLIQVMCESSGTESVSGRPLLRGLYLTSGTQGGTPIDRMLGAFGRELGLERQILPPNQTTAQSFFVSGLLNDVVFAEADRSGASPTRNRRSGVLKTAIASVLVLALAVGAWWVLAYVRSLNEMTRLESELTRANALLASVSAAADPDPRPLLPALNEMRDLARETTRVSNSAGTLDISSRSRRKLSAAATGAYERILLAPFQARIAAAIDTTLRTGADANVQYEALKAYRLLNDVAHFDAAGLKIFVASFWDSGLAPALQPAQRTALLEHMDALLQAGAVGSGIKLEPALVDSVRNRLLAQPPRERLASRLGSILDSRSFPDVTVASLGPAALDLFVSVEGKPEPRHVPGRYTIEAYRDVVTSQLPTIAMALTSESEWVLGNAIAPSAGEVDDVIDAYRASYTQAWAGFVGDLRLKPAASVAEANRQAAALGEANGPLARLLNEIARQTPLRLANGKEGPITVIDPAADRLVLLSDLATRTSEGSAPLDAVLKSLRELPSLRAGSNDRLARIIEDAKREPEPVRSMVLALAERSAGPSSRPTPPSTTTTQMSAQRSATPLGVQCIQLVADRFPFDRNAARDVSFEEFARVFGPKGAFDQFFAQTGPQRRAADVERFRAATRIRDVFFRRGSARPQFELTFRPIDLDERIDRFELDIDGQTVSYAHGPPLPTVVKWPGSQGKARIEVTPASAGAPNEFTGPWALFRLLDRAAIQDAGAPGKFRVIFDVDGRKASFEVQTDNAANPFRLRELERFDCPIGNEAGR